MPSIKPCISMINNSSVSGDSSASNNTIKKATGIPMTTIKTKTTRKRRKERGKRGSER